MNFRRALAIALLVVFVLGTFVFAKVTGGFFPWFVFAFVLVLAVYEIMTILVGLRSLNVTRKLSATRLSAGQKLQLHVTVERSGLWPVFWARVEDVLPHRWSVQAHGSERVLTPLWSQTMEYSYEISNLRRGLYHIGETRLSTGDLLGLVKMERSDARSDTVTVYPRVVPVRGWSGVQPEDLGLADATRRRSDESTTVFGVRDYVPGDRLSRIHWPATARRGALLAKEFEMYVSSELVFVPDLTMSSYRGMDGNVFELAMTTVASLMKTAYERHRPFGMWLVGDNVSRFPVGEDEALYLRCMEALASAEPTNRETFANILQRVAQEVPQGTLLVVISPALNRESILAAEEVHRSTPLQWFAPMAQNEMPGEARAWLQALTTMRVGAWPVRTAEQLGQLGRGGSLRASPIQSQPSG